MLASLLPSEMKTFESGSSSSWFRSRVTLKRIWTSLGGAPFKVEDFPTLPADCPVLRQLISLEILNSSIVLISMIALGSHTLCTKCLVQKFHFSIRKIMTLPQLLPLWLMVSFL